MSGELREIPLIVLAGGFGTRLRSVLSDVPKPLAPVLGKPFIEHMLQRWVEQGLRRFVLSLHHEHAAIEACMESIRDQDWMQDVVIETVIEPVPLGTGGAMALAVRKLNLSGVVLVSNADTWLGSGVKEIVAADAPAMLAVEVPNAGRFGTVVVDKGMLTGFREKSGAELPGTISAGFYKLDAGMLADVPEGKNVSYEGDIMPRLLAAHKISVVQIDTDFYDIGIPEDYRNFTDWLQRNKEL